MKTQKELECQIDALQLELKYKKNSKDIIKDLKLQIEDLFGDTILIAGMQFDKFNLGATDQNPYGGLYTFDEISDILPKGRIIPTTEQWKTFHDNTTFIWTTQDKINGMLFTDKLTGNKLFLPAAGHRCNDGTQYYEGGQGDYWSSSMHSATHGWFCHFNSGVVYPEYGNYYHSYGFSVRCIKE